MNSVNIIGRIATDPLKFPIDKFNKNVVKFALAFDNRTRKTDGVKDTFFIDVEAWDVIADRIYESCHKGDKVGITGHLEQAKFTRKDGSKGAVIKIVVSGVEFLSPKKKEETTEEAQQRKPIFEEDDELEYEIPDDTSLPY
ncbi:single-stranded DNA-binding protein [bacterium]|nr:single-stranded DNA-binding protein [bacterium]